MPYHFQAFSQYFLISMVEYHKPLLMAMEALPTPITDISFY